MHAPGWEILSCHHDRSMGVADTNSAVLSPFTWEEEQDISPAHQDEFYRH